MHYLLTALEASSGVENATKPDPLLIPLRSRMTYIAMQLETSQKASKNNI